jgi:adenylate kinase family enzyme
MALEIPPMQIELIGCTSAGKSTLARGILQAGLEQGIDTLMGDDFVLNQVHLNWVKRKLARTLCVDLISMLACLITWRNNLEFYRFAMRIISHLPAGVAWLEKLNIARNVLKKTGIFEIVRRRGSDQQIVLVDEGTLHTAHYLFVHVSVAPNTSELSTFVRLVPKPDVVLHVQQDEAVLIERTIARGHKRIPDGSRAMVERFIKHATVTFDNLVRQLALEGRLLAVDGRHDLLVARDYENGPLLALALKIIRVGRDAALADDLAGIMPCPRLPDARTASTMLL